MKPRRPSSIAGFFVFGLMYPFPKSDSLTFDYGSREEVPTLVEGSRKLQCVDELRIKTRGHLNTHAAQEQPNVHNPKVRLPVPWYLVLLDEASDDGVRGFSFDHVVGVVGVLSRATRLTASTAGE